MHIDHDKMNFLFLLKPKHDVAFLYDYNTLRQGMEKMRRHGYSAIPVIREDGTYAGTVSEGDFLWKVVDENAWSPKAQEDYLVRDILRPDWCHPVHITATMHELLQLVTEQNFVQVIDDRDAFVGIVTRKDVILYFCESE